ncbi:MAG: aminopeptidase [Bdellovibrionales bacterium RIFOXYC1_FULL_54_43]|nr:MAG: aminopeptidase [Bdellovibrionales bacterium RIFOXYC1_FULL_54_43]OFZ80584.1 MAG: aminopeptidase [Bdellovibrionales bacterium RIFOXYD1_FULL_55_31]
MKIDSRITQLAHNLLNYSIELKKNETVYLDLVGRDTKELGCELIRIATEMGAIPFWNDFDESFQKPFFSRASEEQNRLFADFHKGIMEKVHAYIGVRGSTNPYDLGDLSSEQKSLKQNYFFNEVHSKTRLKKRWCVLRYPNPAMAILAKKSGEAFEDFYFKVCNLDYAKMSRAMDPLVELMRKTDRVRLVSPGTDIEFSIKNIPVIKCDGKMNIPDGEIFTAPVKDSMNGTIAYNTTSLHQGTLFSNITLKVENGRITEYSSPQHQAELEQIFNLDAGARYFGEFAIGLNPYINHPLNDTLFDEKIAGSIHLTPGASYDDASNGNHSSLHWDLVLIQTPEYGGGELYFDGKLVRRDGKFVIDSLSALDSLR